MNKLLSKELVRGMPKMKFVEDKICDACQYGKHIRSSYKSKNIVSTSKPLELIHMDLFGPTQQVSLGGRRYAYVLVDDFSRFTWVILLTNKGDTFQEFQKLAKKIQNELGLLSY